MQLQLLNNFIACDMVQIKELIIRSSPLNSNLLAQVCCLCLRNCKILYILLHIIILSSLC